MKEPQPEISAVILCYKAGNLVPVFVAEVKRWLEKRGISYELVLVANFNAYEEKTDDTPRIAHELAEKDETITVVARKKEGMFGWDVRSGLAAASGKTVAFIDGDGQMPPEDIVRVYDALQTNNADMAMTYRVSRHDGMKRIFISRIYNVLLKLLYPRVAVYDANSKPKIFTRGALEKLTLRSDDWFVDAEIVIQATKLHFKVIQLPTVFLKNKKRASFVKFKTMFEFLSNLIRYRLADR